MALTVSDFVTELVKRMRSIVGTTLFDAQVSDDGTTVADLVEAGIGPSFGQTLEVWINGGLSIDGVTNLPGFAGPTIARSDWTHSTTTSSPPSAGEVRFNAVATSATAIFVSSFNQHGFSLAAFLGTLGSGAKIVVREYVDGERWASFDVTGAVTDNAGWFEIPVAYSATGGTGLPQTGRDVSVHFMQ